MRSWQDLVNIALLGTERRPLELPSLPPALAPFLAAHDKQDPEGALLTAAATLAAHRRAGRLPAQRPRPDTPPAPIDVRPRCSGQAAQHLGMILDGHFRHLLPEWLSALHNAKMRLPEEYLPTLLTLCQRRAELRPHFLTLLGPRGQWLAQQNPDWAYAAIDLSATTSLTEQWQSGDHVTRHTLLTQLRAQDPAQARTLLQLTWSREPARRRAKMVQSFQIGLSMADEPFLETALDDGSQQVRRAAVNLLAQLPQSRLCQRMAERVRPLVKWKTGSRLRRPRLEVALPEQCDQGMQRDGILRQGTPAGSGSRGWWLMQMLAATPLALWPSLTGAIPSTLILATESNEWRAQILRGWTTAARQQQDVPWAEALLAGMSLNTTTADIVELVRILPVPRREGLVLDMIQNQTQEQVWHNSHPVVLTLHASDHTWSDKLAKIMLQELQRHITQDKNRYYPDWKFRETVKDFAGYMPPSMAARARAVLFSAAKQNRAWHTVIQEFIATLDFRRKMLTALDIPLKEKKDE